MRGGAARRRVRADTWRALVQGDLSSELSFGVIPRATRQIFEYIANAPLEVTFSLSARTLAPFFSSLGRR